jgi:hypothetical protein
MEIDLYFRGLPAANIPPLKKVKPNRIPDVVNRVIGYVSRQIIQYEYDITGKPARDSVECSLQKILCQATQELYMRYNDSSRPSDYSNCQRFLSPIRRIIKMTGENSQIYESLVVRREGIKTSYKRLASTGGVRKFRDL